MLLLTRSEIKMSKRKDKRKLSKSSSIRKAEELPLKYKIAQAWLNIQFDRMFDVYFAQLRNGITTKYIVADTKKNRLMAGEFRRYLQQRARQEGWEYNAENFQVEFIRDTSRLPYRRTMLYNPKDENTGFEEVDLYDDNNLLRILDQSDADDIRDNLKDFLTKKEK